MKISDRIKELQKERPQGNSAVADLFFLTEETPRARIRFLFDFDDPRALAMPWHKNYEEKIDRPCLEQFDMECDDCASTNKKTRNNEDVFAWAVWDYEAQRVRILVGRQNSFTLVGKLFEYYEERGSIVGRDFIAKRVPDEKNSQFTKYALIAEDPSAFQFEHEVYTPDMDTIQKTVILARDAELAEALGIKPEERLGAIVEAMAAKTGKKLPAKTDAEKPAEPKFRKRFATEDKGAAA